MRLGVHGITAAHLVNVDDDHHHPSVEPMGGHWGGRANRDRDLSVPGGTRRDVRTTGYSFSQNFLSDLGMTVTHGGQSNRVGAGVFTASFGLLALSIVGCALAFMRIHSTAPRARSLAAAAAIAVLVVGAGLLGAAVSPADVSPTVHMRSAALASATAPLALLLFAAASARDGRLPRGVSVAWVVRAFTVISSAKPARDSWLPTAAARIASARAGVLTPETGSVEPTTDGARARIRRATRPAFSVHDRER